MLAGTHRALDQPVHRRRALGEQRLFARQVVDVGAIVGARQRELVREVSLQFGQITAGLSAANKINAGGNSVAADSGVPPKILYKIISVTIHVGTPGSTTSPTSFLPKTWNIDSS